MKEETKMNQILCNNHPLDLDIIIPPKNTNGYSNGGLLYIYNHLALIDTHHECLRMEQLIKKWHPCFTKFEQLMHDGLTHNDHVISLMLENDRRAWGEIEKLFASTKLQGKAVNHKEKHFRHGFRLICKRHVNRLIAEYNLDLSEQTFWDPDASWDPNAILGFKQTNAVENSFLNYYFAEYDNKVGWVPVPLYQIDDRFNMVNIMRGVEALEHNLANGTPINLTTSATSQKLLLNGNECFLWFEWINLTNDVACNLINLIKDSKWGWDKPSELWTKFVEEFPNVSISASNEVDTNWYFIKFTWNPTNFTWKQAQKVHDFVKKYIEPEIKRCSAEE